MKQYPSIPKIILQDREVYLFDKLDGSCLRASWNPKKGFYKFGSRKQLIDKNSILGKGIDLIKQKEEILSQKFLESKYEEATCYFEFFGEKSFAGQHESDDNHEVYLLDIEIYKKGFVFVENYVDEYMKLVVAPKLLYKGFLTEEIVNQIKSGIFPNMGFEGIVAKVPSQKYPMMFKIKNDAWISKVIEKHGKFAEKYL